MSHTTDEIHSQPEIWREAAELATQIEPLWEPGESLAIVGCGTSWFVAQAIAALRESVGEGITDAVTATEFSASRTYDRVIALSRSGTTTEIIDVLRALEPTETRTTLITAVGDGPAAAHADREVVLDFADETSVVQTRFATSALTFMRTHLEDVGQSLADCTEALETPLPQEWVDASQITFLGTGWTYGLAQEAGLKLREAAQSWTESYYAMEYRHGPISIAEPGRLVWVFGPVPEGLDAQVADTGATLVTSELDPLAHLVIAQRLAVARAEANGLDPDQPRHLTRSVILS
ncbi:MAG: SIS domain-containing protein [bacterium]|nr:SIS domain-containing protein [bacterium]